jgi:hypothetical protein
MNLKMVGNIIFWNIYIVEIWSVPIKVPYRNTLRIPRQDKERTDFVLEHAIPLGYQNCPTSSVFLDSDHGRLVYQTQSLSPKMKQLLLLGLASYLPGTIGTWIPTTTQWEFTSMPRGIGVEVVIDGTCITTGTYGTDCAAPAYVEVIPLTTEVAGWQAPSSPAPTPVPVSVDLIGGGFCVTVCATRQCPGYDTDIHCFCQSEQAIASCIVSYCPGLGTGTASSLGQALCRNFTSTSLFLPGTDIQLRCRQCC